MQINLVTAITKAQAPRHSCNVSQLRRARYLPNPPFPLIYQHIFRSVMGRSRGVCQ